MKRLLVAAAVLALSACCAHAQTAPTYGAVLAWDPVTEYEDGSPAVGLKYNVYAGLKGQPKTLVSSGLTATSVTYSGPIKGPSEWCWYVTAADATDESLPSAEACKVFPKAKPRPPKNLNAR